MPNPLDAVIDLTTVETPAAVIDRTRVAANAERVTRYCAEHGLVWRPHIKTHKSTEVARMQLAAGAGGLTVATPHEAEVMAQVCSDLLLAYPLVGEARIDRVLALPDHVRLRVALDSTEVLEPLAAAARAAKRDLEVLVEVDMGLGRVGVQGVQAAVALARQVVDTPGFTWRGVLFYAGHVRDPGPDFERGWQQLKADLEALYGALVAAGLRPEVVSGGTTPSLWRSHELPHLTEVRAGTCIFNDRDALSVGAATPEALAYSVLTTVISTSIAGRAAVDAGSKALAKEPRGGAGTFGFVLEHPEVEVVALSEEHGVLDLGRTDWRPHVGERVHIVPNHVCVSVNLQDRLLVADGSESASASAWPIEARGRLGSGAAAPARAS